MKRFNLSKIKADNILHQLKIRGNFLFYGFSYNSLFRAVLYLPEHSSEARKMFAKIRNSIPKHIRYAKKGLHKYLLYEARKIKLQNPELPADLLAEVIKWKLKVIPYIAKKLIAELENL